MWSCTIRAFGLNVLALSVLFHALLRSMSASTHPAGYPALTNSLVVAKPVAPITSHRFRVPFSHLKGAEEADSDTVWHLPLDSHFDLGRRGLVLALASRSCSNSWDVREEFRLEVQGVPHHHRPSFRGPLVYLHDVEGAVFQGHKSLQILRCHGPTPSVF